MDTLMAFAMGQLYKGRELMVFDWEKAARLINERKPRIVEAGLSGDWEWTGGVIYKDGKPVFDDYTFLASTWAVPEICFDEDVAEVFPCYRMKHETPGWDSDTKWPYSSISILDDY